jgi:Flp pilus assembly protein TadG
MYTYYLQHRVDRSERGQAGAEAVAIALILGIAIVLLFANVWVLVDAKMRVGEAAREGARAIVEANTPGDSPTQTARTAGSEAFLGASRLVHAPEYVVRADNGFGRCGRVAVQVRARIRTITLPFVGRWSPDFEVQSTHSEIIDPFRSGLTGELTCDA